MKTSDRAGDSLVRNPVFHSCLLVVVFAIFVSVVLLISHTSESRKLTAVRNEFEEVRTEFKVIAEKNNPSDITVLGNNQIKRNLAGQIEEREEEILKKSSCDKSIEKQITEIDALQNHPDPEGSGDDSEP